MEIRMENDKVTISGYVNSVARDSKKMHSINGDFVEQVLPKVWTRALRKAEDVKILFNHREDRELGSIKQGNLALYEDAIGLKVNCTIEDKEVIEKARNGEIRGWSFGFKANEDIWEKVNDNLQRRYLKDINLLEVSILTLEPAYEGCFAEIRSETSMPEIRFNEDKAVVKELESENKVIRLQEFRNFAEMIKDALEVF